jgi:hypothetical protein
MWRYPFRSAISTAFSTSWGFDCHVPSPIAGILAPVLRVYVFLEAKSCELYARAGWGWYAMLASLRRLLL